MSDIQEIRQVYYDADLNIEAYHLSGVVQKFPNHFHDYYVIGFIEGGRRRLWCKDKTYDLKAGDLILFNPRDNHYCAPIDGEILDYRAVNIQAKIIEKAVYDITGVKGLPRFTENVVFQSDITASLDTLFSAVMNCAPVFEKEEAFYFMLGQILQEHSSIEKSWRCPVHDFNVQKICGYIEAHYAQNISLNDLTALTNLSKSYLLRLFTKQTGISPYRYLQTMRIAEAKKLLEAGTAPIEAAMRTGFSDQSHFTNTFKEFIGLTPKQYQRIFIPKPESKETEAAANDR